MNRLISLNGLVQIILQIFNDFMSLLVPNTRKDTVGYL